MEGFKVTRRESNAASYRSVPDRHLSIEWRQEFQFGDLVLMGTNLLISAYAFCAGGIFVGVLALVASSGALGTLVNKSVLEVSGEELVVRGGPVPWPHTTRVAIADLRELFAREVPDSDGSTFLLIAGLRDGTEVTIVCLANADEAVSLAEELNRFLELAS